MLFDLPQCSASSSAAKLHAMIVVAATIILFATAGCEPAQTTKLSETVEPSTTVGSEPSEQTISPNSSTSPSADSTFLTETTASTDTNPTPQSESASQTPENFDGVVINGEFDSIDWNALVGQQVAITGKLTIVDAYDLARRGRVVVARERLYVPTSHADPNDADPNDTSFQGGSNVAKVTDAQKRNDKATLTLDDGSDEQNKFPPTLFPEFGSTYPTVRAGSTINGVAGQVKKSRGKIVLVPNRPLRWTPAPRPKRPSVGDANITVASFNVLNYFTTIDDGDNNARGADSKTELVRQEDKIVSAIVALQADVIGLMELENNVDAEQRLVAALNKTAGKAVFKGCGLPDGFDDAPGGDDSIRVGIIYRSDRVSPMGDASMIDDKAFHVARTPIVQRFKPLGETKPFELIVNHFKSKGASKADEANKNKGDGQGAYNAARRAQALAITHYIDTRKRDDQESRVLVIGDLNAYQQEDPVDALRSKGLVDIHERFASQSSANQPANYSYMYYGQCGSLDHAFATDALAGDVTGIATWHINADEPRFLDYNEEFNPKALYKPDPFRSSDHDPVLIGIR